MHLIHICNSLLLGALALYKDIDMYSLINGQVFRTNVALFKSLGIFFPPLIRYIKNRPAKMYFAIVSYLFVYKKNVKLR